MNNQVEQFSNILTIVLIFLVIILFALTIVYISMKAKESKPLKTGSKNNKDKPKDDSNNKTSTLQNLNKQSILDFMEFDKIEDNMIIQKGGKRYVMVVECQGINYDLMSEMEKTGVEEGFIQFLNTLRHPIQIYVQTRAVNLAESIQRYKTSVEQVEMELNKKQIEYNQMKQSNAYTQEQMDKEFFELTKKRNLYEYGKDIIKNTEMMSLNKNVLTKKYYVVIPYYSEDASKEEYTKDEIQNMAFSELYTKAQSIIRTLFACSVSGRILNSYELVELLYNSYNREQAEVFGLNKAIQAGYEELYSTAPDVFIKRERILDKQIQEEAMKLAKTEVDKARSKTEEKYIRKKLDMDSLIGSMAKKILNQNKAYIGDEITEEAIKSLDSKIKSLDEKGENANVGQEKTRTRRGRKPKAV